MVIVSLSNMKNQEISKMIRAAFVPAVFVAVIGLIHFLAFSLEWNTTKLALYPRTAKGLIGILSAPLLHADFNHLFNNSVPLLILGSALFYFYREIAWKVSTWVYLMVGVWTWVSARDAYHLGASGLLYGLFSFLLISGFLRRNSGLIALSFVVTFLYGSLVWGIFPIDLRISFEGHLWGFIAGGVLAFFYRKQGPQKKVYEWPEEDDLDEEDDYWNQDNPNNQPKINYIFIEKSQDQESRQ